jgi:hypothetical protein
VMYLALSIAISKTWATCAAILPLFSQYLF